MILTKSNDENEAYTIENEKYLRPKNFLRECFSFYFAELFKEALIKKSHDEEYRELKNKKLKLEISIKEKNHIPIENVLAFISGANSVFMIEQERLMKSVIESIRKGSGDQEIEEIFSKQKKVYSSDEFYRQIYD